ncbi:MAG: RNA-directed DNA polymerase [Proteobacteria bacterium]|nr:RNA-directed DNA polymerase [Pseudomonadota bacterium]
MLVEALQKQSGLPTSVIMRIAETASKRYKAYKIPKRSGGWRDISHPSRELKAIQRWINRTLFMKLPIHESATAYAKGSGIRRNAEIHAWSSYTLRLDFENFFPSFDIHGISEFIAAQSDEREWGLTKQDVLFVGMVVTRYGRMTIGAPSSPILTNAMMYMLDSELAEISEKRKLSYTRYADDIFLSAYAPDSLADMIPIAKEIVGRQKFVRLKFADEKTAHLSKRYKRSITGLVVTPDQKISIGRERKRTIKSLVFRFINGELGDVELMRLSGTIAFVYDVERAFYDSLVRKYGEDVIGKIQKPHLADAEST